MKEADYMQLPSQLELGLDLQSELKFEDFLIQTSSHDHSCWRAENESSSLEANMG